MPALLPIIPPQQFEAIRSQICAILTTELPNQYTLDNTRPRIAVVDEERCLAYNSDTDFPRVNVNLHKGDYGNSDIRKSEGTYLYNIDVYVNAITTVENGPADQYAMKRMSQVIGMIRAILMYPEYRLTLLLPKGALTGMINVERFFLGDRTSVPDALSNVVGRIQLRAGAVETVPIDSTGAVITLNTTKAYMSDTVHGYYWSLSQKTITASATGATLTDVFFDNPVTKIKYGSIAYYAGTDFTQVGTTITATTFTFTDTKEYTATIG